MSTGQSAVMLCGWGVKAGWIIPFVDKTYGWQVKLCDPSLTRAIPAMSTLEMSIALIIIRYAKSCLYTTYAPFTMKRQCVYI